MRLLSFGKCGMLIVASAFIFGVSQVMAITSRPTPEKTLLWTRQCAMTVPKDKPKVTCGDDEREYREVPEPVVAALKGKSLDVTCSAYEARRVLAHVSIECVQP